MSAPAGLNSLNRSPWQRAAVGLLLAADRVKVRDLLAVVPHVAGKGGRQRWYRDLDRELAVAGMLHTLGQHGAIEVMTCCPDRLGCPCGAVIVRDQMVLQRVAMLQSQHAASQAERKAPRPATPATVKPDAMPGRTAGRALRVVRDGEAS